jgi:squalene-hopene/tetraprenyl-beta-curcumene cyclase
MMESRVRVAANRPGLASASPEILAGGVEDLATLDSSSLGQAIGRARQYLLSLQSPEGYWVGELESDVSVTAGYVPFMRFLEIDIPDREQKVVNLLRSTQLPDGGWSSHPGGEGSLDVSVQAYLALKMAGCSTQETFVQRARDFILAKGGVERAHTFTKIMLALFGQFDWARLPMLPPELMLLPNSFPINIYDFASWARATIVALSVIMAYRPIHPLPEQEGVGELHLAAAARRRGRPPGLLTWERFFLAADRLLKIWERSPWKPGRARALSEAIRWIRAHQEADGSWGGIMLPWVYSLAALKCAGYSRDDPTFAKGEAGLEEFILEDDSTMHLQPAVSPVWDTAYSIIALRDSGLEADHPALVKAAHWLLEQQVLTGGDWQVKRPRSQPGGWAFEFENDLYPDVDDSVLVPIALRMVQLPDEARKAEAIGRSVRWVLSMQGRNGGWAAFDVDNHKELLAHIPFADFMTPLDPVSVDVTAHVVELMARLDDDQNRPALKRALRYLRQEQEDDGAWFGRWGVNYIYGTAAVLMALHEVGEESQQGHIRSSVRWLKSCQDDDGGWGESCLSYEDADWRGIGPSSASQTAWAVLGLLAAGEGRDTASARGIQYLIRTQRSDGGWDEEAFTGTGFPRAFYLRYHMYPIYFPLMALSRYRNGISARR